MKLSLDRSLLLPRDRVLVGVSGGPDSLALLHALTARRDELQVELVAAHLHHGMRGEEAEADVRFLEATCRDWGVPLAVERADVPSLARERGISVEEAGREARYTAFDRRARAAGCGKVATAHTADDLAETVLMNLFRGAGVDGLAGIPPRRPLSDEPGAPEVIRPLLPVWRREVEAYCRAHGLQPREDRTNRDLRYLRSRVRFELLPHLAGYDPRLKEHLVRLARQAREEGELLAPEAEALLSAGALPTFSPELPFLPPPCALPLLALDGARLAAAKPALLRRALRLALRRTGGLLLDLDTALVEKLAELVRGGGPSAWDLPGAPLRARRSEGRVFIERAGPLPPPPEPHPVRLPGSTDAPEFGLRLCVEETGPPSLLRLPSDRAVLDAAALRPPLVLRTRAIGDRFRPLGALGARLLSDLLAERKVPRSLRPYWPLLADEEGILWVVGLGVAERARVHEGTVRCARLTARPTPP